MSYYEWMAEVDRLVEDLAGVSVYDLPDCLYRDWYDARYTPLRAARRALKEAGF